MSRGSRIDGPVALPSTIQEIQPCTRFRTNYRRRLVNSHVWGLSETQTPRGLRRWRVFLFTRSPWSSWKITNSPPRRNVFVVALVCIGRLSPIKFINEKSPTLSPLGLIIDETGKMGVWRDNFLQQIHCTQFELYIVPTRTLDYAYRWDIHDRNLFYWSFLSWCIDSKKTSATGGGFFSAESSVWWCKPTSFYERYKTRGQKRQTNNSLKNSKRVIISNFLQASFTVVEKCWPCVAQNQNLNQNGKNRFIEKIVSA
jgi:hypothetical protein